MQNDHDDDRGKTLRGSHHLHRTLTDSNELILASGPLLYLAWSVVLLLTLGDLFEENQRLTFSTITISKAFATIFITPVSKQLHTRPKSFDAR